MIRGTSGPFSLFLPLPRPFRIPRSNSFLLSVRSAVAPRECVRLRPPGSPRNSRSVKRGVLSMKDSRIELDGDELVVMSATRNEQPPWEKQGAEQRSRPKEQ